MMCLFSSSGRHDLLKTPRQLGLYSGESFAPNKVEVGDFTLKSPRLVDSGIDLVVKIGGSVLNSSKDYAKQAEMLGKHYIGWGNKTVVVVSAARGVTDSILSLLDGRSNYNRIIEKYTSIAQDIGGYNLARRITRILSPLTRVEGKVTDPFTRAYLLSLGELASRKIFSHLIESMGIRVVETSAEKIVSVRGDPLNAVINYRDTLSNITELLGKKRGSFDVLVVEGFVGGINGKRVVLGRGGSDYTATALASLLDARYSHLVTSVDGIYTRDPGRTRGARRIEEIGYAEASAAARMGAKKLHPRTFEPHNMVKPVEVRISSWTKWTRITTIPEVEPPKIKLILLRRLSNHSQVIVVGSKLNSPSLISLILELVNSRGITFSEMQLSPQNNSLIFSVDRGFEEPLLNTLHSLAGVY